MGYKNLRDKAEASRRAVESKFDKMLDEKDQSKRKQLRAKLNTSIQRHAERHDPELLRDLKD